MKNATFTENGLKTQQAWAELIALAREEQGRQDPLVVIGKPDELNQRAAYFPLYLSRSKRGDKISGGLYGYNDLSTARREGTKRAKLWGYELVAILLVYLAGKEQP